MHTFYSVFKINLFKLDKLYSENIGLNWTSEIKSLWRAMDFRS